MPNKNKDRISCDLKIDATYLTLAQIIAMISESIDDGFSVIGVSRTITPKQDYALVDLDLSGFDSKSVRILQRVTVKISSVADLDALKTQKAVYERADLIALEFSDVETFEAFSKRHNDYGDNLIYINIASFPANSVFLKALKNKNWYVELDYGKLLNEQKRKQALVSFYKLLDSHYDKLILSSDANSGMDRRAEWELQEMLNGLMERSGAHSAKMAGQLLRENPLAVVRRALLRKQGFARFEQGSN